MPQEKTLIKPVVIILNGYARSGKDTFVDIAEEEYGKHNVIRYSTVDTIKAMAADLGWDGQKTPESRNMLADFKDFYTKHFDGTFIEMVAMLTQQKQSVNPVDFVFMFIREPSEIGKIAEWCACNDVRCHTIFIKRDSMKVEHGNDADNNVENYCYDVYTNNNLDIEHFRGLVLSLLQEAQSGKLLEWLNYKE